jgi:hypothetical protein
MIKPVKAAGREEGQDNNDELVKKQRKLLVNSLVKDFYPSKFNAGQMIKQRDGVKIREN